MFGKAMAPMSDQPTISDPAMPEHSRNFVGEPAPGRSAYYSFREAGIVT
jgi:hypothetical protein